MLWIWFVLFPKYVLCTCYCKLDAVGRNRKEEVWPQASRSLHSRWRDTLHRWTRVMQVERIKMLKWGVQMNHQEFDEGVTPSKPMVSAGYCSISHLGGTRFKPWHMHWETRVCLIKTGQWDETECIILGLLISSLLGGVLLDLFVFTVFVASLRWDSRGPDWWMVIG